jgi:hypothetical protein
MHKKLLLTLLASFFVMSHALADIQFNGFASVVTGIDLEDDGNPTNDYQSRTADNLQESKVGLQWTANLDNGMRFIGQTVARGDSEEGFVLTYDWAYFDINVGDSGKLKFGRLRIPFYKYSDYLDVGYAYHWITPPKSMYSLNFSNVDGVGYQQNFSTGSMDHSINAVLGRYQGNILLGASTSEWNLENLVAINYSATMGSHEFYVAYAQADTYIDSASISGIVTASTGADANEILVNGDTGTFVGAGYKGSFGPVSVFAETSQVKVDNSIIQDSTGSYVGVAYTMGEFTYHVTYEMEDDKAKTYTHPYANAAAQALGNRSSDGDSSTVTLGVRKDIGTSSALKVEASSYTEDRVQTAGLASSEEKALLLRVALETMF